MIKLPRLLLAASLACAAFASGATAQSVAPPTRSPADLYGALFRAVQLGRVFPDGKTFVDATPISGPARVSITSSDSRTSELSGTLQMASVDR